MPVKSNKINNQIALYFNRSKRLSIDNSDLYNSIFTHETEKVSIPKYCHQNGLLFTSDSIEWFRQIKDSSIDLVFADPPYNIKKADWDKFESQEAYISWSLLWIKEASRVLKPTGSLYICGFSEILADLKHPSMRYFSSCKWLIWSYKNKANLGNDWGRSHESILHLRKSKDYIINVDAIRIPYSTHTLRYPSHPQAETSQYGNGKQSNDLWNPNPLGAKPKDFFDIPTICNGMAEKTKHPTQKPEELLRKIILASSNVNDIIVDPFSGSGTTLVVSEQLGRKWIGCDICDEYNDWAIDRIENVICCSINDWIEFDRINAKRRESIRCDLNN
jgi:site-specific DNA-methyltransferase (adenine-specific)